MSGGRRAVHPPEIAHERQRRCAGRQPGANWRITSGNCANCGNSRWTRAIACGQKLRHPDRSRAQRAVVEGPVLLLRRQEEVPRLRRPLGGFARDDGRIATCDSPASWTRQSAWPLPRDFPDADWHITSGNCGNCGNRCCAARSAPPPVDPTPLPVQLARISAIVPLK
jgi:hypothetical protein